MVKIQNLWVGFAQSGEAGNGVYQVWFSTSSTCPTGMSSWFMNAQKITQVDPSTGVTIPDTNKEVVSTVGYKLFNRYQTETRGSVAGSTEYLVDEIPNTISTTTSEVESCAGLTHKLGNWSAYRLYNANKATHLYEITYWEYIIMCYVFAAYFGTFNIESQYGGITSGSDTAARNHVNGSVTINASTGMSAKNTAVSAYAFMWIENALHGKQYIWTAGCSNRQGIIDGYMDASYGALDSSSGASWKKMKSYVTFSANKANSYVHSSTIYDKTFNFTGLVANSGWNGTVTSIDLFAFPQRYGAGGVRVSAASSGFYDEVYTNTTDNTVMYVGGYSNTGSSAGLFCRFFHVTASPAAWSLRGFATLDVKSGS